MADLVPNLPSALCHKAHRIIRIFSAGSFAVLAPAASDAAAAAAAAASLQGIGVHKVAIAGSWHAARPLHEMLGVVPREKGPSRTGPEEVGRGLAAGRAAQVVERAIKFTDGRLSFILLASSQGSGQRSAGLRCSAPQLLLRVRPWEQLIPMHKNHGDRRR